MVNCKLSGYFDNGKWVETPGERLEQQFIEALSHFQTGIENMAVSMNDWNLHSGNFEKGAELTVAQSVDKVMKKFSDSIMEGLKNINFPIIK